MTAGTHPSHQKGERRSVIVVTGSSGGRIVPCPTSRGPTTRRNPASLGVRRPAVGKGLADQKTERLGFDSWEPPVRNRRNARFTGVSAPGAPSQKARVQAISGYSSDNRASVRSLPEAKPR